MRNAELCATPRMGALFLEKCCYIRCVSYNRTFPLEKRLWVVMQSTQNDKSSDALDSSNSPDIKKEKAAESAFQRAAAYQRLKDQGTLPKLSYKSSRDPQAPEVVPQAEIVRGKPIESKTGNSNSKQEVSVNSVEEAKTLVTNDGSKPLQRAEIALQRAAAYRLEKTNDIQTLNDNEEINIMADDILKEPGQNKTEDLYKPKVSTWGVFPRPADISRTYGGGRTILPGEALETEEEMKIREERTRKLLAEYKLKAGLAIDPRSKLQCEKAMEKGEKLMDRGMLQDAIGCFEDIKKQLVFQTELHGRAILLQAICLDSLNRSQEAKLLYEKLSAHPNQDVKKKAKQYLFSFEAMENLKFTKSMKWDPRAYRRYFDTFAEGYNSYNTLYKSNSLDIREKPFEQLWPYMAFLLSPFLLLFVLVLMRSK